MFDSGAACALRAGDNSFGDKRDVDVRVAVGCGHTAAGVLAGVNRASGELGLGEFSATGAMYTGTGVWVDEVRHVALLSRHITSRSRVCACVAVVRADGFAVNVADVLREDVGDENDEDGGGESHPFLQGSLREMARNERFRVNAVRGGVKEGDAGEWRCGEEACVDVGIVDDALVSAYSYGTRVVVRLTQLT